MASAFLDVNVAEVAKTFGGATVRIHQKSWRLPLRRTVLWGTLAIFAAALRWAACGESFWVDELHTAWCVDGSLDQVARRAAAGNQQPAFFAALWLWNAASQHVLTWLPVEPRLRLPIVAASVASVVLIADAVRRATANPVAAWMIAIAAALEINHVFYGSELRPYAVIDLAVAAMLWLAIRRNRHHRAAMHAVAVAAIACHVTALPIVAMILTVDFAFDPRRPSVFATLLWILTIAFLAWWIVPELWRDRGDWSTMSTAGSAREIFKVWPLAALVVVPAIVRIGWPHGSIDRRVLGWALVAGLVVVATWAVSDWVPLWHRRYLVGTLPPLWLLAGALLGRSRWPFAGGACVLAALAWHQGPHPWPMVERGENWRAAVAFVNQNAAPGQLVWLDPGLIEQSAQPTPVIDPAAREYFAFAVRGPYRLAERLPLRLVGDQPVSMPRINQWLISRRRTGAIPPDAGATRFFGTVRVIGPMGVVKPMGGIPMGGVDPGGT